VNDDEHSLMALRIGHWYIQGRT